LAIGRLVLPPAKTHHPVLIPLPKVALDALVICDEGNPYYLWSYTGKLKTALTDWQEWLKKLFIMAGFPEGHGHRLRDSLAVSVDPMSSFMCR
jgi:hypothetical protein